jgi:molybdenum cofactor cytidylyltransferase
MDVTCVILAAGLSRRFGSNKLLHAGVGGITLLERAVRACGDYPIVAVALPEPAYALREAGVRIVLNSEPDRGMTHSLRLAHAVVDRGHTIAVLPADLALVEPQDVRDVIELRGTYDVVYPVSPSGAPGHPVVFSPHARGGIARLHDGDTIHELRDAPGLRRRAIVREGRAHFADVDTPADLVALI